MSSDPFGSSVTVMLAPTFGTLRITHQPFPSVAAAVKVCVIAAVMSMDLAVSAVPRIVFVERDS